MQDRQTCCRHPTYAGIRYTTHEIRASDSLSASVKTVWAMGHSWRTLRDAQKQSAQSGTRNRFGPNANGIVAAGTFPTPMGMQLEPGHPPGRPQVMVSIRSESWIRRRTFAPRLAREPNRGASIEETYWRTGISPSGTTVIRFNEARPLREGRMAPSLSSWPLTSTPVPLRLVFQGSPSGSKPGTMSRHGCRPPEIPTSVFIPLYSNRPTRVSA